MNPQCSFPNPSLHKKSIFGLKMTSAVYLLLFAICLANVSAGDTVSCPDVRKTFEKKGMLSVVDIQEQPNSDAGELCLSEGCCAASSRAKQTQQARTQLEGALRSELGKLAEVLANRARRFDEFFRKLLKLSREEFHAMFKRTYGMIYEQHSYVFEQLFEQLERYYSKGGTNFDTMMEGFFGILYQKMFTVLNAQYSFDDKYLKCVNEHMRDIQPFEDVPNKLSVQLKRAFVATRTFHKALRAGADVVRSMMQVGVTQECVTAWTRLRYCGTCAGLTPPPCSRYCHNVLRGCLPTHADLADLWDGYVDGVEKVADRLLGPFNIAMVVEPIDIKISEAIMSFQEHNQEISQKIFADCGRPVLGGAGKTGPFYAPSRSRRSIIKDLPDFDFGQKENDADDFEIEASFESLDDPLLMSLRNPEAIRKATKEMEEQAKSRERFLQYMRGDMELEEYEEHERRKREADPEPAGADLDFKPFEFEGKRPKKKKPARVNDDDDNQSSDWANRQLQNVVKETRNPLKTSKQYWRHLPAVLCTSTSVTSSPCFNGSHVASYTLSPAGEGSAALASNPEVRGLPPSAPALDTAQQALRTLTARLKDAYNGLEVQWKDEDDLQLSASASNQEFAYTAGSGSGSGDDTDDTDDLPDDDEDNPYYPEGSGKGPTDDETTPPPYGPPAPPVIPPPVSVFPIVPIIPSVVDSPPTNNVQTRGRVDQPEPFDPVDNTIDEETKTLDQPPPVPEETLPSSAQTISLHRAMFTYAFPVVCAWFGTIVTDLF